ncbi:hypothetical protein E1283_32730 [Streptomyces hainanensis]|uniref:Uncharacterized protein n=1 Tax=Streptomyces hainanensis TaxID=402648 RepID=A0A4R4SKD1_9ACTN|nr:hypothetical protein E1283_32730 [Streptomyces hainanensis]
MRTRVAGHGGARAAGCSGSWRRWPPSSSPRRRARPARRRRRGPRRGSRPGSPTPSRAWTAVPRRGRAPRPCWRRSGRCRTST